MTAEIDMTAALYPIIYVREAIKEKFGISTQTWYYHVSRMPQPSVRMSGYEWYTHAGLQEVKTYFATTLKRRAGSEN